MVADSLAPLPFNNNNKVPIIMIKAAVEKMQLCQIHFYQKIARKKVARVNAALS